MNFLAKLPRDKFKIHNRKNLVRMDLFLSFLTVELEKSNSHLGRDMGWTEYRGDNNLIVSGGWINGVEYLDSLKYKKNLDNSYNDFVNPFYLFEIFNDEGKKFFLNYYSDDIKKQFEKALNELKQAQTYKDDLFRFWISQGINPSNFGYTTTIKI